VQMYRVLPFLFDFYNEIDPKTTVTYEKDLRKVCIPNRYRKKKRIHQQKPAQQPPSV